MFPSADSLLSPHHPSNAESEAIVGERDADLVDRICLVLAFKDDDMEGI